WHELAARAVDVAREAGAVAALPVALSSKACADLHAAKFSDVECLIDEGRAISMAMGTAVLAYTELVLAGWRGRETEARDLIEASLKDAIARGEGRAIGVAECASAVLYNGLGRYDAALTAARRACKYDDLGFYAWSLTELVEAAARCGDHEAGAEALA